MEKPIALTPAGGGGLCIGPDVFEAYRRGGLPLTTAPSQCVTPADAAIIAQSQLTYVGHLLGDPAWFPVVAP